MPDYQSLYFKLFRASEEAINLLIAAQRECEGDYISSPDPGWSVVSFLPKQKADEERE